MRLAILIAGLFLAFAAAGIADPAPPTSAEIQKHVEAAEGPTPAAVRERRVETESNGSTWTQSRATRGADERTLVDEGPFHEEYGELGGQSWRQDANGQTLLEQPDPGLATKETYVTAVSRVHEPVDGYEIDRLNAEHHGTRRFIDLATWRELRFEAVQQNGTVVTTYDDFRLDGGRTFAHHWHTVNPIAGTTSDTHVTAYTVTGVGDADVAIPEHRRILVGFPSGTATVTLPTTFSSEHILVRAKAGERGLDFTLDSGASGIYLDLEVAKQLGLHVYEAHDQVTAGRHTIARTIVPELDVGPLVMKNVVVGLIPENYNEVPGMARSVGLMGFDFFAELGLTIDYLNHSVAATYEPYYQPPAGPDTAVIPIRIGDGIPYVSASLNGALGERFLIDTGGAGAFMIFDYFARRHPEALVDDGGMGSRAPGMRFFGVGGEFDTRPLAIANLHLGTLNLQDFIGYQVLSKASYAGSEDGLLGPEFLREFNVGFDYGNSTMYLQLNADGRRAKR